VSEIAIRFVVGGLVVSAFALISDLFKPKTFAGLFGAAPSVALASLGLIVVRQGKEIAATEARSMIIGAVALMLYAMLISYVMFRYKRSALTVSLSALVVWAAAAVGLWYAVLGA
jgi:hypothetical protein